jgi:plastocyanin
MRRRLFSSLAASLVLVLAFASTAMAGPSHRTVQILDDCDAETFNAVLGPGACVKDGDVTFEEFAGSLIAGAPHPAWRFSPTKVKLDAGGTVTANNRGGEFHTFTEVAQFGGGCVQEINDLMGLQPVPECANAGMLFGTTGVAPGGSLTTGPLASGAHRFMCIIHPSQRTTVVAS